MALEVEGKFEGDRKVSIQAKKSCHDIVRVGYDNLNKIDDIYLHFLGYCTCSILEHINTHALFP